MAKEKSLCTARIKKRRMHTTSGTKPTHTEARLDDNMFINLDTKYTRRVFETLHIGRTMT